MSNYLWETVAGDGNKRFSVLHLGETLHFFEVNSDGVISTEKHATTISLSQFLAPGAPSVSTIPPCRFAAGQGFLFVVNKNLEPFYVSYDPDTDDFTASEITIKTRDFEGLDDDLEFDDYPTTLTKEHEYNLRNQGWDEDIAYPEFGIADRPRGYWKYQTWRVNTGSWPSNAEIWWLYKSDLERFEPWIRTTTVLNLTQRPNIAVGNTKAPRGRFILEEFYQDRESKMNNADASGSLAVVSSGAERPTAVAHFAGRVWYAGVQAQKYTSKIYFTQITESENQFGQCYQKSDPTSENSFELLPDDGGVVSILDAGTIYSLVPSGNALIVLASNGTWAITGSQGLGFKADDYSVSKISNVAAVSSSNVLLIEGQPTWWNFDGIYSVTPTQIGGFQVQSISDTRVRTHLQNIPAKSKQNAVATYNPLTRVAQWLYRSTSSSTTEDDYEFDKILNLNAITGGFYTWTTDVTNVKLHGLITVVGPSSVLVSESVTDSAGVVVTDAAAAAVTTFVGSDDGLERVIKYLVSYNDGSDKFTFAEARDATYYDWVSFDETGVSFSSYFTSGYRVHGDGIKKFQPNYLTLFLDNTERGSFDVHAVWDYSTHADEGRWSQVQRVIASEANYSYIVKRLKMRGHGKALQFKIASVAGEPFDLIGFVSFETANASP